MQAAPGLSLSRRGRISQIGCLVPNLFSSAFLALPFPVLLPFPAAELEIPQAVVLQSLPLGASSLI